MVNLHSILFTMFLGLLASTVLGAPTTTLLNKRQESGTTSSTTYPSAGSPVSPFQASTTPTGTLTPVVSVPSPVLSTSIPAVGTCTSGNTQPGGTVQCSVPTNTPLAGYLYPNISFTPECSMIELCPEDGFGGQCLTVPTFVNGDESESCEYVDLTQACINMPFQIDDDYGEFLYLWQGMTTRSVRAGNNYTCAVYSAPYCATAGGEFTGIVNDFKSAKFDYWSGAPISSFHCWRNGTQEPTWGQTSVIPITATPTSLSIPTGDTAAVSSLAVYLEHDFNPFIDEMLLCGGFDTSNCTAWNSSLDCQSMPAPLPAEGAVGFGINCNIYACVIFVRALPKTC